jgi:predicted GIY-YIG superfamily endonuclease
MFVYILRCSDGSDYVGHTGDRTSRVACHNAGHGAAWTACRLPATRVLQETQATVEKAVRRERQIKGWTRAKKEALIGRDFARLKAL